MGVDPRPATVAPATLACMIMNFPAIDPVRALSFDPHGSAA